MEVFGSKTSGENLLKELEKLVQNHLENLVENSPQKPTYIGLEKLAVGAFIQPWQLTVNRPGRPPTVRNLTVGPAVDHGLEQRAELSASRPTRSTGAFQRAEALWRSTDPVDWPSSQNWRARLCTSVDRLGRPTPTSVDRPGRPA